MQFPAESSYKRSSTNSYRYRFIAIVATLLVFSCLQVADAGLIISSFTGGRGRGASTFAVTGFRFTVGSQPVWLTKLGHLDRNLDGLLQDHQVGVWTDGGALLTSATVPQGTSAPLDAQWRMVDITPLKLSANTTYRIASQIINDGWIDQADDPTPFTNPLVTYNNDVQANSLSLGFPGDTVPASDDFRPNANGFIVGIPEPTSFAILSIATVTVLCGRRRSS